MSICIGGTRPFSKGEVNRLLEIHEARKPQMLLLEEERTHTQRLSAAIDEAYQRYALGEPDAESNLYKAFRAQAQNVAIHRLDWDRFEEFDRDVVHRANKAQGISRSEQAVDLVPSDRRE